MSYSKTKNLNKLTEIRIARQLFLETQISLMSGYEKNTNYRYDVHRHIIAIIFCDMRPIRLCTFGMQGFGKLETA